MELPAAVMIRNEQMGMKGTKGTLLAVSPDGYYEVNVRFGDNLHRVMLPVEHTVLISQDPEEVVEEGEFEVER